MHVEFVKNWGDWKAGEITSEIESWIGNLLIQDGQAKRSDVMAYMRAETQKEINKTREELGMPLCNTRQC